MIQVIFMACPGGGCASAGSGVTQLAAARPPRYAAVACFATAPCPHAVSSQAGPFQIVKPITDLQKSAFSQFYGSFSYY